MSPRISFEFFPPQSFEATFRLADTVRALAPMHPSFVSVTYGAGGTTRELTHDAVAVIHKNYGLNVAAHLTCVNASKAETMEIVDRYAEVGVSEIVALRGDPPKGQGSFTPHPEGFANSAELVAALAETGKFKIRVGAYPDPHPDAQNDHSDIDWLKVKCDAGADSAITQFFFEPDNFFRFRDRCAAAGIDKPIIPGILPIDNWNGVRKFAMRCGAHVPEWVDGYFDKAAEQNRATEASVELCTKLCEDLIKGGVEDLHFYTLNRPELTQAVAANLGITADSL